MIYKYYIVVLIITISAKYVYSLQSNNFTDSGIICNECHGTNISLTIQFPTNISSQYPNTTFTIYVDNLQYDSITYYGTGVYYYRIRKCDTVNVTYTITSLEIIHYQIDIIKQYKMCSSYITFISMISAFALVCIIIIIVTSPFWLIFLFELYEQLNCNIQNYYNYCCDYLNELNNNDNSDNQNQNQIDSNEVSDNNEMDEI